MLKARHRTMIYIGLVEHGSLLKSMIQEHLMIRGLCPDLVEFVHSERGREENEQTRKDFIDGKVQLVISTSIWGEGTDIPPLRWCIYAKAGLAGTELEQVIGRELRIAKGKRRAGFVDFRDEHDKDFATRFRARKRFLEKKGYLVKVLDPRTVRGRQKYFTTPTA